MNKMPFIFIIFISNMLTCPKNRLESQKSFKSGIYLLKNIIYYWLYLIKGPRNKGITPMGLLLRIKNRSKLALSNDILRSRKGPVALIQLEDKLQITLQDLSLKTHKKYLEIDTQTWAVPSRYLISLPWIRRIFCIIGSSMSQNKVNIFSEN